MKWTAVAANIAWVGSSLPAWRRLTTAFRRPEEAQRRILRTLLYNNVGCAYGQEHGFDSIKNYSEFAERVPLTDYESLSPWIERIKQGETAVLTKEPVTRLVPTSGSSGARKLIPFTATLQQNFNAAVGPWMVDLWQQQPSIALGPAYWSITPAGEFKDEEQSAIPIGFDDDGQYLGGFRRRLVESILAGPSALCRIQPMDTFFYATLLCLLREPELRLISVWHPSFLSLLFRALPFHWEALRRDLRDGTFRFGDGLSGPLRKALNLRRCGRRRCSELARADPTRPDTIWPNVRVISCWEGAGTASSLGEIRGWFPTTMIQPKGLIATEAVITLPFGQHHPIAVNSHFFEFIDSRERVYPLENLQKGQVYEVVVTTGGGLWRYRMKDKVEVTGFVHRTPSLKFLGRGNGISDLCGEKLSEAFVGTVLREISSRLPSAPAFIMIAPENNSERPYYTLYIEGEITPDLTNQVERLLRKNPHYAYCRDLGQLAPLGLFRIAENAETTFLAAEQRRGFRIGDIKPRALSRATDWSMTFRALKS